MGRLRLLFRRGIINFSLVVLANLIRDDNGVIIGASGFQVF